MLFKDNLLVVFVFILWKVNFSESEECCKDYIDGNRNHQNGFSCPEYCCYHPADHSSRQCCMVQSWQVSADDRKNSCESESWWKQYIWVPIVASLVALGIIVICGIAFFKLRISKQDHVGAAQQQTTEITIVMPDRNVPKATDKKVYLSEIPSDHVNA